MQIEVAGLISTTRVWAILDLESFNHPRGAKCHGRFIKRAFKVRNMLKYIHEGNDDNHIGHQGLLSILSTIMSLKDKRKHARKTSRQLTCSSGYFNYLVILLI